MLELRGDGGVWRSHNQRWHQHRLSMAMAAVAGLSMVSDQQRKQERCVMCELWTLKLEVWKNCYFRGTGFTQGTKVLWLRVTFFLFPPPTRGGLAQPQPKVASAQAINGHGCSSRTVNGVRSAAKTREVRHV